MKQLKERVADLSIAQRRILAIRLADPREQAPAPKKRLSAYLVVRDDANQSPRSELREAIRGRLAERLPAFMIPDSITLVDSMPRLPNGKIDVGRLPSVDQVRPTDDKDFAVPDSKIEKELAVIWSELLHTEVIDVRDNFFEIGGDSILTIQLISRAREAGLKIEPSQIADYPTIQSLASVLSYADEEPNAVATRPTPDEAPPTPIQQWFFQSDLRAPDHWNQARRFELDPRLTADVLSTAVDHCVDHHDALRTRFRRDNSQWIQFITRGENRSSLEVVSILDPDSGAYDEILRQRQSSLDIENGPLIRFLFVRFDQESKNQLIIIAHHLIIDQYSWAILIEDLNRLCADLIDGADSPTLAAKTASVLEWSHSLAEYSQSRECLTSAPYWAGSSPTDSHRIPLDHPTSVIATEGATARETRQLDLVTTQQLQTVANNAYKTRTLDLLLTAFAWTLADWVGRDSIHIDMEGHGREADLGGVPLDRSVGWFTSFFPVTIRCDAQRDISRMIKSTKEQFRELPHQGFDYGVLRYLSRDASVNHRFDTHPKANVLFNYSGGDLTEKDKTLIVPAGELNDGSRSDDNQRSHLLEVNVSVADRQLQFRWTYSHLHHRRETIASIANQMNAKLRELVQHCVAGDAGGFTPSDFPEAELDQDELDSMFD